MPEDIMMDWNDLFPPGEPVVALPNWNRPRLLLSARDRGRRWSNSSFYRAHRLTGKIYRMMLRMRRTLLAGEVRHATGSQWPLAEFLADIVPSPLPPTVQIGTFCAACKWTVRVCGPDGEVAAYVKWGKSDAARHRLAYEHEILQAIPRGIGPVPLKLGEMAGGLALAIRSVGGKHLPYQGKYAARKRADFLEKLTVHTPLRVESHPGFRTLMKDAPIPVMEWIDQLSDQAWPVVIHHGDLAPWNLFRIPPQETGGEASMAAIDWEYGSTQGVPFLDAAYYSLQVAALLHRRDPQWAVQFATRYLVRRPWPALSPGHAEAMIALTAYDGWRKALEDGDSMFEPLQQWQRNVWDRRPQNRKKSAFFSPMPPARGERGLAAPLDRAGISAIGGKALRPVLSGH